MPILVTTTNFYFKIFKLSFVKVSRGCFHLLNMQTFEHKKLSFYKVNLYPQNFLYPIFDFLLEDYLIGLAIMNDNMDEEHDVHWSWKFFKWLTLKWRFKCEVENDKIRPKIITKSKILYKTQICPKVPKHEKSMHKRHNSFSINKNSCA